MSFRLSIVAKYALAMLAIFFVTAVLILLRDNINSTTVALTLLLIVLFIAALWGSRPAYLASVIGMLCFNYYFLPPIGTLTIADPQNWVALGAFIITALVAGKLSELAKRRAEEAERRRQLIESLYHELQEAFERTSQAEALRQSERLKSALLDAVTHDLRTPLTSIKASVTTLLAENAENQEASEDKTEDEDLSTSLDAEGRRDLLEVINEETDRLNRFIESLVELARIEAGELNLRRRWSAVDEIIVAALERAESLLRQHQVAIEIEEELPVVRVDSSAVVEVVYNLLENGAKYSPKKTRISVAANRAPDEMIEFSVTDEGRGIPFELRERVFDKFFRVSQTLQRNEPTTSGIGMGLAIARGIIEAHGGHIKILDGEGGRGTRVSFILPIGDDEPRDKKDIESRARAEKQSVEIAEQDGWF